MRELREKKASWAVMSAGLGGFLLGALTVLFIVWAYSGFRTADGLPAASPDEVAVQPAPAETPPPAPAAPPSASSEGSGSERPWVQGPDQATPPSPAPTPAPGRSNPDLRQRNLVLPVQGIHPEELRDTFAESRSGGRVHEALDIMAPRNTPVVAVDDGRIAKLYRSVAGGITIYQYDPAEHYAYYYAHLDHYAPGLHEGQLLHRGELLGYVGTTGNAPKNAPHLHFALIRLDQDRRWWKGTYVDPYPFLAGK